MAIKPTHQAGFTLVEVMVAVAILAILATIAAPSFQGIIASSRVSATTNEILELIALAQSEARKRQLTVAISIDDTADAQTWTVTPSTDEDDVIGQLTINAANPVEVNHSFTNISFTPNGRLGEATENKSVTITSTSSYSSKSSSILILGGGKIILDTP